MTKRDKTLAELCERIRESTADYDPIDVIGCMMTLAARDVATLIAKGGPFPDPKATANQFLLTIQKDLAGAGRTQ